MSGTNNGVRKPERFPKGDGGNPPTKHTPGQRAFGFIIGCVFALAGLLFVAVSVAAFEEMKKPPEVVYVPRDAHDEALMQSNSAMVMPTDHYVYLPVVVDSFP